jgi:hypothetical protein
MRASFWREVSGDVPRDVVELHDDMDLSYRVDPTRRVIYDRSLIVGISGRPLANPAAVLRRLRMARVTFDEHLPEQSPLSRWSARVTGGEHKP